MRAPVAAELLKLWEAGLAQPTWDWTSALIRECFPNDDAETVAALTIGERDARLLEIRETLFGHTLNGCSACPSCGARVEMDLVTDDIRGASVGVSKEGLFQTDGCRVHFRVPTTSDLQEVGASRSVEQMRDALLRRCVLSVERAGATAELSELPNETVTAVIERMSECDPQADVHFQLRCPECHHSWSEAFDITSYLWTELDHWSQRTLQDVHRLATAYGWRESDVLAVSPQRRARYLEMIGT
jgi:hypothetical protein